VLHLMHVHGYLPKRAINAAMAEAKSWKFSPPRANMRYPQFVRYVENQLHGMPRLAKQLYRGIDIYTTLDPRLQNMAQSTVSSQIGKLTLENVTDGALVSMDLRAPHYGWILAMVGSANYRAETGQINMAVRPRQPGSSMKPFNYIWAFEHGVGPATTVVDDPIILPDPNDTLHHGWYEPANYDRQFHGPVTLRQALANSLNVPAVKVEYYVTGAAQVAKTAHNFGMTSLFRDNPGVACNACYSVTLGGLAQGTRLLEETAAYGTFATGGWTVPPIAIWKIVKRSTGKVLFCSSDCPHAVHPPAWITKRRKRVVDAAHAYEMTSVLSDNNARCTVQVCEFGLNSSLLLSHPAAAKTGTTNAFTDNWTLGYTPQIVTGVWAGNADRTPMVNVIGVTGAGPIWHDYMENAFKILNLPAVPFVAPASVVTTDQCSNPPSTIPSFGTADIYVQTDPLPLCRLPEHSSMPIPCSHYPQPLPLGWECPFAPAYSYTYGNGQLTTPPTPQAQQFFNIPSPTGQSIPNGVAPAPLATPYVSTAVAPSPVPGATPIQ
ncbi:MAG: transglycosylase domain-containing protein, partial [Chloroflexota bacterium]